MIAIEKIKNFLPGFLVKFFTEGNVRSLKAKKNILLTFIMKGIGIIISFMLVPLTINYVNSTNYGIWLTVSSVIIWFNFFDIGLGNGLRNKLAEALANNDLTLARTYVSTTYAILSLTILPILLIFFVANPFLNWVKIFNTAPDLGQELGILMLIVFTFFCLKFVLQLLVSILYADQRPAIINVISLVGNIVSLLVIYILTKTTQGSLIWLGTILSVIPVIVLIFASYYFFRNKYKAFAPSFKFIRFRYAKDLLSLGFQFFLISIAGLIIFSSSNMIISQLYGPAEVTPYNIAYKYFSIVTMVFTMTMVPFWSAFTEAFHKQEFDWIRTVIKKLLLIWILFFVLSIIMLMFSDFFYKIWVGKMVTVPFRLSLALFIFVAINSFSIIFTSFLNGVGKIRLSLLSAIFEAIIFIPAAIFFAKHLNLGIAGIVLASAISPLIGVIWMPIQCYKLINKKATGLWNK